MESLAHAHHLSKSFIIPRCNVSVSTLEAIHVNSWQWEIVFVISVLTTCLDSLVRYVGVWTSVGRIPGYPGTFTVWLMASHSGRRRIESGDRARKTGTHSWESVAMRNGEQSSLVRVWWLEFLRWVGKLSDHKTQNLDINQKFSCRSRVGSTLYRLLRVRSHYTASSIQCTDEVR